MSDEYWPPDKVKVRNASFTAKQATLGMKLPFSPSKKAETVIDLHDFTGKIAINRLDPAQALKIAQNTAAEVQQRTLKVDQEIRRVQQTQGLSYDTLADTFDTKASGNLR